MAIRIKAWHLQVLIYPAPGVNGYLDPPHFDPQRHFHFRHA